MRSVMVSEERADRVAGGVFLIGLAILFLPNGISFWPGILFVIGASSLAKALSNGQAWQSAQGALWMFGIGLVFLFGFHLPLLLILIGGSLLLGLVIKPSFMCCGDDDEPAAKPKRKSKLKRSEDGLEYYESDTDWV
ncbi:hypothetical protein ACFLYO_10250 [Chloroflexota bacterium]